MPVVSFNPDAHVETNTVDGFARGTDTTGAWGTNTGGAGVAADDSGTTMECGVRGGGAVGWKSLRRAIFLFNVSLPAGAEVTAARLRLYPTAVDTTLENLSTVLVSPSPASNTALVASDFNRASWSLTALSSTKALGSTTINQYNDWSLNASGLALIMNGVVKLGLMLENDRANSAPTNLTDNAWARITMVTADDLLGVANPPILEVTYTIAFSPKITIIM